MVDAVGAVGNQSIQQTTQDVAQRKEAPTNTATANGTGTSEQQEQTQALIANFIGIQAVSMLSQSGAMVKQAAGKANEVFKELKEFEKEEERDRQQEFGMPEY